MTKRVGAFKDTLEKPYMLLCGDIYIAEGVKGFSDILRDSGMRVDADTVAGIFVRDGNTLYVKSCTVPELRVERKSTLPVVNIIKRFTLPKGVEVEELAQL